MGKEEGAEATLDEFLAGLDGDGEDLLKSLGIDPDEGDGGGEGGGEGDGGDPADVSYAADGTDGEADGGDAGDGNGEGDGDEGEMHKSKAKPKKKGDKETTEEGDGEEDDDDLEKSLSVEADPLLIAALNEVDDLRRENRRMRGIMEKSAKLQAGMYKLLKGLAARSADEQSEPEEPKGTFSIFGKSSRVSGDGEKTEGPNPDEVLVKSLQAMSKGLVSPTEAIALQNAAAHGQMDDRHTATYNRLCIQLDSQA